MIIDISIFNNWNKLFKINDYSNLKKNYYLTAINDPLPEDVILDKFQDEGFIIYAPLSICFLLNYYRGKESNDDEVKKYFFNNALKVYKKKDFKKLRPKFEEKMKECEKYYIRYYKPSYDILYGKERAQKIKEKISSSMKSLDKEIIEKRNIAIKKYAENRPQSHNDAIRRSKHAKKEISIKNNQSKYLDQC